MLSCRNKGILNHDREMTTHADLEGSNNYPYPKAEDEAHIRLIMKS